MKTKGKMRKLIDSHDSKYGAYFIVISFFLFITGISCFAAALAVAKNKFPIWLAGSSVFEWVEIPNTRIDQTTAWKNYKGARGNTGKRGLLAYSGAAVKADGSEFFIAGGGHLDYAGNEVFSIRLDADRPVWVRRNDPSADTPMNSPYYPDGRPSSRHTYRNLVYSEAYGRLISFGGAPWGDKPRYDNLVASFDPATNDYDPPGTIASAPGLIGGPSGTGMDARGNFYIHSHRNGRLYMWRQQSNTWVDFGKRGGMRYDTPYALDTKRNRLFRIPWGNYPARIYDLDHEGAFTNVRIGGPAASQIDTGNSLVYDPVVDVFWLWKFGENVLYRIDAASFAATVQPVTGALPPVSKGKIYSRFHYVPELRGIVLMTNTRSSLMFIRTAP